MKVLDVGGGRYPILPPETRPDGLTYTGLDISPQELLAAPAGSYDDHCVGNVALFVPELAAQFDLIVSYNVFEHVKPLGEAFDNMFAYARPGGILLAQFAATFSYFAMAGRIVPSRLKAGILERFTNRDRASVFPAYYDHCWATALRRLLRKWSTVRVEPLWGGASYLGALPRMQRVCLAYEELGIQRHWDNIATHYLVTAAR